MADVTLAGEVKDWLTSAAIVVGGGWAMWRFGHAEWLRRRAEIPSLEGNSSTSEICSFGNDRVAVSLRWSWRNVGTRPVHVDDMRSFVEVYRLAGDVGSFVDPRQQKETLTALKVGVHHPLKGYGFYMFEPNTTSTMLTVSILPVGEVFIARHRLYANRKEHPTGGEWQYSWERWQVFRTDAPSASIAKRRKQLPHHTETTARIVECLGAAISPRHCLPAWTR
jgi:hypothetical protein